MSSSKYVFKYTAATATIKEMVFCFGDFTFCGQLSVVRLRCPWFADSRWRGRKIVFVFVLLSEDDGPQFLHLELQVIDCLLLHCNRCLE